MIDTQDWLFWIIFLALYEVMSFLISLSEPLTQSNVTVPRHLKRDRIDIIYLRASKTRFLLDDITKTSHQFLK